MAQLDILQDYPTVPPIDIVEQVVESQGWRANRVREEEMAAEYSGKWCDYSLHFAWSEEFSAIHFTCAFDIRIPDRKKTDINNLLALVNDRLWLGHFCIWQSEGLPMYRHAFPLRGAGQIKPQQVEDLLEVAISECEKFYPAFQFVIWGGKDPQEAMEASVLEPIGEA